MDDYMRINFFFFKKMKQIENIGYSIGAHALEIDMVQGIRIAV